MGGEGGINTSIQEPRTKMKPESASPASRRRGNLPHRDAGLPDINRRDPPTEGKPAPTESKHGSEGPPLQRVLPWDGPGCTGGDELNPVNGLGCGVKEFFWTRVKPFTDGIPPDIAGHVLNFIRGPENVVVVTPFPESAAVGFAKLEGRALFEEADEFEQVAAIVCTLDKNMKVVGHQTVRMKPVGMAGGAFEQQKRERLSGGFLAKG